MIKLSSYMAAAKDQPLPEAVTEKAKQHILDTFAAMVSGSELPPGKAALKYANEVGGKEVATVVASNVLTGPVEAALINGMLAHSDETDDSHAPSQSHPGCGVVPAAFAAGELFGVSGTHLLRAVALGYDVGTRVTMTLGAEPYENESHRSTHQISPTFGASAAAGCAAGLTDQQMRWVLNYAAEQAGGIALWNRDPDHIEKGFDFAGGPARDGMQSAIFVHSGWTGLDDVFSGPNNFFLAFNPKANPEGLIDKLGFEYEVAHTDIKRWTVGMPIQAPLDAMEFLRKQHPFTSDQVTSIAVKIAPQEGAIVDNRALPDICMQHVLAVMLIDNTITFQSAHDRERMKDPAVLKERAKVTIVPDEELGKLMPHRQATVTIKLADGQTLTKHVDNVRGTEANPMTSDEVKTKARELIAPTLGASKAQQFIDRIFALEKVKDIRELRGLLQKA
jgi:2-methylcitrate dehydratase PrpD